MIFANKNSGRVARYGECIRKRTHEPCVPTLCDPDGILSSKALRDNEPSGLESKRYPCL